MYLAAATGRAVRMFRYSYLQMTRSTTLESFVYASTIAHPLTIPSSIFFERAKGGLSGLLIMGVHVKEHHNTTKMSSGMLSLQHNIVCDSQG